MRFPTFLIEIPLVDETGASRGSMWKSPRRKPKYFPRVGERLYVLPEISLRVDEINYSGFHYNWITIRLESISNGYRTALESQSFGKRDEKWKWRAKDE